MPSPAPKKYGKQRLSHRRKWTNQGFAWRRKRFGRPMVGVAEGDSWFDYSPAWFEYPRKGDLLAHLMQVHGGRRYNIYRVSKAGDTLDNMAYGTGKKPTPLEQTLKAIRKKDAKYFLFSAGGNDVAGPELEALLNHHDSGLPPLKPKAVKELFKVTIPRGFEHVIDAVHTARPGLPVFLHGYGYTKPTGKAVVNFPGGFKFIGPWLLPFLKKKGWHQVNTQAQVIRDLIDGLNTSLSDLAAARPDVHFIDLRPTLRQTDWINELHLNQTGWAKVTRKFDQAMRPVLGL
ncbi:MAG: GDSL-type esterase/lipase family protein [Verrucomicrobiota bacterium]